MRTLTVILFTIFFSGTVLGCSANYNPASVPPVPGITNEGIRTAGGKSHYCWGLWQMVADPVAGKLDVIELREAAFHLNALPFLEPPPLVNLTLEYLQFIGTTEIIADVGLRHPFLGMTEFTGFDVCGVFISSGTSTFGETGLTYAAGSDTHLLNPDGWTRWWNPGDFPQDGTIFNYKDGMLGTPNSTANFNTDLNPYKYYTDELTAEDNILKCTPAKRGQFSAGQKNIRRFDIHLGSQGLVFNYAVDACWEFPQGAKPWTAPDDFGENANRPEPWAIKVTEIKNTLWNDGSGSGGNLSLSIDVYDHYNTEVNEVLVQSQGNFTSASSSTPISGGVGYSTYQIDITGATPAAGSIPLYYIIECEQDGYAGKIPGAPISAYFMGAANVSSVADSITVLTPNGGEKWQVNTDREITWEHTGTVGPVKIEYSKDGFTSDVHEIIPSTPNDGSYMWKIPFDPSDTVRVRISDAAVPSVYDISDNVFSITLPDKIIHVDDDNVSGPWEGTKDFPFNYIQAGVLAVPGPDYIVWVHPGKYYELDQVTIQDKTNLTIYGENYPIIHPPYYLGSGKAAFRASNSPGLKIDSMAFSHNYAYQSANWFENCSGASIINCKMVPTLSPYTYGFLEFVRVSSCPDIVIEKNNIDNFNTASTFMSLMVISNCNNARITLNTCRNFNYNTGYNLNQTAEGYISCSGSSNVEISKNIFGKHSRSCSSANYVQLRGIVVSGGSNNIIRNNLIYDCWFRNSSGVSTNNRAIYVQNNTNAKVYNNTIDRFGPTGSGTGTTEGIYIEGGSGTSIYNNIITNLVNPQNCFGVYSNVAVEQSYSDVWNLTGTNTLRYAGSATEGTGGINLDPKFTDPASENYKLLPGSPCIGTGLGGHDMGCHGGTDPL